MFLLQVNQAGHQQGLEKMKKSAQFFDQAKKYIPGGVTANIKFFAPHPIVMNKGKGSRLWDIDNNEYIDYLLCYGSLILGHGHPAINEAVHHQLTSIGTAVFGAPHDLELKMAQKLIELFPSMDMVRYTNSGLEATLLAIRLAQAYTGKIKIGKFEGHYHGGYDQVLLSVSPNLKDAGDAIQPNTVPDSEGIPGYYIENTIILPFNDLPRTEQLLHKYQHELAAIILEPVQGGFIPIDEQYVRELRELTKKLNILLIFDEVKTGFRLTLGGAQSIYEIDPDITALGKVLGGGFPIGAIGGKRKIMEMMSPDRNRDVLTAGENMKMSMPTKGVFHSGTYNGHPTVLAAGLATIEVLSEQNVMTELIRKTNLLREKLEEVYTKHDIPMQTLGMGSIFNIILSKKVIKNYRDMYDVNSELRKKIDYELLEQGVYTKPLNRYSMSTAHTEEDILLTVAAHDEAIKRVKEKSVHGGGSLQINDG